MFAYGRYQCSTVQSIEYCEHARPLWHQVGTDRHTHTHKIPINFCGQSSTFARFYVCAHTVTHICISIIIISHRIPSLDYERLAIVDWMMPIDRTPCTFVLCPIQWMQIGRVKYCISDINDDSCGMCNESNYETSVRATSRVLVLVERSLSKIARIAAYTRQSTICITA